MTKDDLTYDIIKNVVIKKGYKFFTAEMDMNFIGIRSKNYIADNYDDFFCMLWIEDGKKRCWINDKFTTDPGIYYLQKKLLNANGCAIMVPGQYRGYWKLGFHNGYEAFQQVTKADFYRDRNRDNILDGDASTIEHSIIGANMHHGYDSKNVSANSAGCQVHKHDEDLNYVIKEFKRTIPYHGDRVTYTLLTENDFTK